MEQLEEENIEKCVYGIEVKGQTVRIVTYLKDPDMIIIQLRKSTGTKQDTKNEAITSRTTKVCDRMPETFF